ncbi:MAG: sodium-translocating pyrophosphatase [Chloroflexota bacterium]
MNPIIFWLLGPIGAIAALVAAYTFYNGIMKESEGTEEMIEIAQAIREGAMAYLRAQYQVMGYVFAGLFVIFLIMSLIGVQNFWVTIAFLTAGFFSGAAGFVGMKTATNASARTANAARQSLNAGLQVAFRAGAVMGLTVVGFILLDSSIWFVVLYFILGLDVPIVVSIMLSAAVGASTMALFGRVGGGIYTKAADVGADLVGKVEAGIPEDDPRNPATIADNVGDNVGDVAGMGADLYESYLASILATAVLGVASLGAAATVTEQLQYVAAPVMLAGIGVLFSIGGVFLVRADENATMAQLLHALEGSTQRVAAAIGVVSGLLLFLLGIANWWQTWIAVVVGILIGILIGRVTEYYTSADYAPTKGVAEQAETGPATVIISGLALGMESAALPVIIIVIGTAIAFYVSNGAASLLDGLFGVGMAAVGMLSTLGLTLATDAYGPVADNAGGNAEMAGLDPSVRERTDQLDALGNTTAAIGKGFAIGSAALTGLALLAAYLQQISLSVTGELAGASIEELVTAYNVTPLNPTFLFGLLIGGMVAFYFCALTMSAVGRSAGAMVEEVRRQFRTIPGIMEYKNKPDYAACVEISTQAALREMRMPSILAIIVPAIVGIILGVPGVLGLLSGALATGFSLAVMMANAGGAWDNAKKYVEAGNLGGKGSENHKATVVGDTVGDPFKDTSGPALNILIKLMSVVSVVLAGLVAAIGGGFGLIGFLIGG